jgi:hypothetical protein
MAPKTRAPTLARRKRLLVVRSGNARIKMAATIEARPRWTAGESRARRVVMSGE